MLVYRGGRLVRSFVGDRGKAVDADAAWPVLRRGERAHAPGGSAGAPYALALSARSNVLQEFEGGPGQVAIHGVHGLVGTLGTAASPHGCIRVAEASIRWLAARVWAGVPVSMIA